MKIDKYSITATARVHHIYSYVNYGELGSYISNQIVYTGANNKILCLIADKVHLSLLRVTKYFYQNLQHIIFMVCRLEHVPSWRWWKCIKVSQKSVICFRTGWIYQQISQSLYCNQIGSNPIIYLSEEQNCVTSSWPVYKWPNLQPCQENESIDSPVPICNAFLRAFLYFSST